jgi:hypothetical protein
VEAEIILAWRGGSSGSRLFWCYTHFVTPPESINVIKSKGNEAEGKLQNYQMSAGEDIQGQAQ